MSLILLTISGDDYFRLNIGCVEDLNRLEIKMSFLGF